MNPSDCLICHRRKFLRYALAGGAGLFTSAGLFAETLLQTPFQTEGPFYPDKLPLDTDNDLLIINDQITPAVGEVTHLHGQVSRLDGSPARGVEVELWVADAKGCYLHTGGAARGRERDGNFQGYGRFLTGMDGRYYFRAIKPVAYGPRTPHYHFAVNQGSKRMLTTQCYIKGHELNKSDRIYNSIQDPKLKQLLLADFQPLTGSKAGELTAKFDIVIGATPEDRDEDTGRQRRGKGKGKGFRPGGERE